MASIQNRAVVTFTIPLEQYIGRSIDGQIILKVRANITKTKRFFRRLKRLCKKYGYTVGEIQTTDAEAAK